MHKLSIVKGVGDTFYIEGFLDAIKVIHLIGPDAENLEDLAAHLSDLKFALECLEIIKSSPNIQAIVRDALWFSAVGNFFKCFGHSESRTELDFNKILEDDEEGKRIFTYYKYLRNKHLFHDENYFSQTIAGAILNKAGKESKIEEVITQKFNIVTLDQSAFSNVHLLCTKILEWIEKEYDSLAKKMKLELEEKDYSELLVVEPVVYRAPSADDISKSRRGKNRVSPH